MLHQAIRVSTLPCPHRQGPHILRNHPVPKYQYGDNSLKVYYENDLLLSLGQLPPPSADTMPKLEDLEPPPISIDDCLSSGIRHPVSVTPVIRMN